MVSLCATYDEAFQYAITGVTRDPEEAKVIAERTVGFYERGWRLKPWVPRAGTPMAVKRRYHYGRGTYWKWQGVSGSDPVWIDHPYRLVNKAEGRTVFVAEPYDINADCIADLYELGQAGWDVSVKAGWSLHCPGGTVAIWIERKKDPRKAVAQ